MDAFDRNIGLADLCFSHAKNVALRQGDFRQFIDSAEDCYSDAKKDYSLAMQIIDFKTKRNSNYINSLGKRLKDFRNSLNIFYSFPVDCERVEDINKKINNSVANEEYELAAKFKKELDYICGLNQVQSKKDCKFISLKDQLYPDCPAK